MKKISKIIGATLAGLIILLILAMIALITFVNPNDFKGKISQVVYQQTGKQLTIAGNISWSFYPGLGIKADEVTLKNLVSVGELKANVKLMPLFHGQIKAGKLVLKDVRLDPNIKIQKLSLLNLQITNPVLKTLTGSGKVIMQNGTLQGINIPYVLKTADSLIHKKPLPQKTSNATNFGNLTGTFTIKNGILTNKDLFMDAPEFQVTGQGTANLINQRLNYQLKAQKAADESQIFVPIKVTGTFSKPKFRPDINYAVKQAIRQKGQQVIEDVGKEITKGIGRLFR